MVGAKEAPLWRRTTDNVDAVETPVNLRDSASAEKAGDFRGNRLWNIHQFVECRCFTQIAGLKDRHVRIIFSFHVVGGTMLAGD
ncbi:hypothetical protein D0Z70_17870 [Sphingobium terrigena]|uniref:Uncharacterized protein n=1 Tax=Sphingobium terrigena TaxID=2304063 RepID=A0A418YNS5_9SPHN|nr:hypothetical protein D0Z70_17870 [Sphingobium terrigena]